LHFPPPTSNCFIQQTQKEVYFKTKQIFDAEREEKNNKTKKNAILPYEKQLPYHID